MQIQAAMRMTPKHDDLGFSMTVYLNLSLFGVVGDEKTCYRKMGTLRGVDGHSSEFESSANFRFLPPRARELILLLILIQEDGDKTMNIDTVSGIRFC